MIFIDIIGKLRMQPLFTELKNFKKSKIDNFFSNPQFTYTHSSTV